jgi:hypothetical protein
MQHYRYTFCTVSAEELFVINIKYLVWGSKIIISLVKCLLFYK